MATQQKITNLIESSAPERLRIALELVGVERSDQKHHRYTIISAIMHFAGVKGDAALEAECGKMLELIKVE